MFHSQALHSAAFPAIGGRALGAAGVLAGSVLSLGLAWGLAAGQLPAQADPAAPQAAAPIVLQDTSLPALQDKAETARARLLAQPGVSAVTLEGLRQQGLAIDYSPRRLAALGISPQELAAGLQTDASQSRPGHLALAAGSQPSRRSVADRVVKGVRLGDVAVVSRVKLDPPVSTLQVQGVPAVLVMVAR